MTALAHPQSGIGHVFEHRALQYRRTFRASLFSSFLTPVLFLAAMGLGLGTYVDSGSTDASLGGVTYLQFLAPGLLATTCMQSAAFEAAFPIMSGLIWTRIFHAMHATPISGSDIALGNIAWITVRMLLIATVFTFVMFLFGAVVSPTVIFAIPVAALTGLAFATPIMAFSATQRTPEKFNAVFRFGITPLFLFSGTFFPVDQLPTALQVVAWLTPSYHGVALTRSLSLGTVSEAPGLALIHLLVLIGFTVVGAWFSVRLVTRKLVYG